MQQDNKQRTANGLAVTFLVLILLYVVSMFVLELLASKNIVMPTNLTLIYSELIILVPGIVYVIKNKLSFKDDLGFRKIKIGTVFMAILLSYLVTPVVSFVNVLSQLFVSNTMVQASDSLLEGSQIMVLFLAGIYGPLCEEIVFRGIFNNGYVKISSPMKAALVSGLLFGLMHMNLNQACYAFVLGLIFAIINRASGSIFTSAIIHMAINTSNMLMLMVVNAAYSKLGISIADAAESTRTESGMIYMLIAVYLVLAIVFGAICIPCVVWISKHEGHYDELVAMFKKNNNISDENAIEEQGEEKVKLLINVPMIIAIVICFIMIFALNIIYKMFGVG